jgi:hypothetical protein
MLQLFQHIVRRGATALATFELIPHNLFSQDYKIILDGERVADISNAWVIQGGQLNYAGKAYKLYREESSGAFVLEEEGKILARAKKSFTPSFDMSYNAAQYTLTAKVRERSSTLQQGTQVLGSVEPKKKSLRKATASFSESLPKAVQIFVVWLAILLYRPEDIPTTG